MNRIRLLNQVAKYSANRSFHKPIMTTQCSLRMFGSSPPPPDDEKKWISLQKQINELKRCSSSTKDWLLQVERDGIASFLQISNLKVLDICNHEKIKVLDTRVRALEAVSVPNDATSTIKKTVSTGRNKIALTALFAFGVGILKHYQVWVPLNEYNDAFLQMCEELGVLFAKLVEELMK